MHLSLVLHLLCAHFVLALFNCFWLVELSDAFLIVLIGALVVAAAFGSTHLVI
jgi:hypothetical protein